MFASAPENKITIFWGFSGRSGTDACTPIVKPTERGIRAGKRKHLER
jgi:hypothetical protein